ncbi:MAG: 2-dehydropantoate 2-reductase [Deltaproteobacteria bacterium]|nr:2-dehydropantoate 2-reductase [Deltaproteobacteria bacterium]
MNSGPQKIGIVGSGVVGNVLAAHLGKAGHAVCVLDVDTAVVEAINDHGIRIEGILELDGRVEMAVDSVQQLAAFEPTLVVVCVKSTALERVTEDLADCGYDVPAVMSFQNGLDTEEVLARRFPLERVFRGVVNYAGAKAGPNAVRMTFFHPPNHVGSLEPESREAAEDIAALITGAGLPMERVDDIRNKVWRKAILNACLMPISVITRLSMNHIMGLPETRAIVVRLMKDFMAVARAEGHVYENDFVDNALKYLDGSGGHKASMLMDFEAGNPLEIDYLNGRIQEYADRHRIPCETNRLLLSMVQGQLRHRDLARNGEG